MKIKWAEKAANEVKGYYEHYFVDTKLEMKVRIYLPDGINTVQLQNIKRIIPKNFYWCGIYYCQVEKEMYILIVQK